MAWKDEIQEEANKVANASWASTLRDSMYTSLTKLANFYETILVELTPKIEEKAEAKTLEILGGANSESVAAEVVLARDNFETLDLRLDYIDTNVATNTNELSEISKKKYDILFNGKAKLRANTTVVTTSNNVVKNYDEFEIQYHIYSSNGSRKSMPSAKICGNVRYEGTQIIFFGNDRSVIGTAWVQIGEGTSLSLWCPSISYTTDSDSWNNYYFITKIIGIKH